MMKAIQTRFAMSDLWHFALRDVAGPRIHRRTRNGTANCPGGNELRLWSELDEKLDMDALSDLKVLLLGFNGGDALSIQDHLKRAGVGATCSIDTPRITENSRDLMSCFDLVIVNHDAHDDVASAVDAHLSLRALAPDVAVILVSRSVGYDDLSSERAPICDATLKLPLTGGRLSTGITAALHNRKGGDPRPAFAGS